MVGSQKCETTKCDFEGLWPAHELLMTGCVNREVVIVWLFVVACGQLQADRSSVDEGENGSPGAAAECWLDSDCEPAAISCCECATFAVPLGSGPQGECDSDNCEPASNCSSLAQPACLAGLCDLSCQTVPATRVCETGFRRDGFGCLVDECESGAVDCLETTDCARVPADCCGCERGGKDTAVGASRVDEFLGELGCPQAPQCPGVNTCDPDASPECIASRCFLVVPAQGSGSGEPDRLCGTAQLGPCPTGQMCILNDPVATQAGQFGVGVCRSV